MKTAILALVLLLLLPITSLGGEADLVKFGNVFTGMSESAIVDRLGLPDYTMRNDWSSYKILVYEGSNNVSYIYFTDGVVINKNRFNK